MSRARDARHLIEQALAFTHAALDQTTPHRVAEAKAYAEDVLPRALRLKPRALPLSEAHTLYSLLGQLRAALDVLDWKIEVGGPPVAN